MVKQRRIRTSQLIQDIRSGWDSDRIMTKYDLSVAQLNRTLQKLVTAEIVSESDIRHLVVRQNRQVRLNEFARDLRRLMAQYGITPKEAEGLLANSWGSEPADESDAGDLTVAVNRKKKRRINARELAEDIQLGLDHANLLTKYGLTESQLEMVIQRLIRAGLLSEAEVYDRSVPFDTQLIQAQAEAQAAIDELE